MARPRFPNNNSITSPSNMISLPDSFHHSLTLAPDISKVEIENSSVSDLLEKDPLHQGFIYKRAADKKTDKVTESVENVLPVRLQFLSKWQLRYVVIYSHYVVYFKKDSSGKPVGWFSLKDYNRVVRAQEMGSIDKKWPFKIIGMRASARTWIFCTGSEREMRLWMACFKATMDHGIHGKVKQTCLDIITLEQSRSNPVVGSMGDESRFSASSSGSSGERFINDTENYEDLESPTTKTEYSDDMNYDDIDAENESESGSSGSGSGGRMRPLPGSSFHSASNTMYLVETISGPDAEYEAQQHDSYFTSGVEYLAVISDDESSGEGYGKPETPVPKPADLNNLLKNLNHPGIHRKDALPSLPAPSRLPRKPESRGLRREPDGNSFREAFQEKTISPLRKSEVIPLKPKPLHVPKPILSPKPRTQPRNLLPDSAVLDTTDKSYAELFLRKHQHDGMYLIRGSSRDPARKVIMVWHAQINKSRHYTIFGHSSSSFALDNSTQFGTLLELIEYYKKNYLPTSDLKLSVPCPS